MKYILTFNDDAERVSRRCCRCRIRRRALVLSGVIEVNLVDDQLLSVTAVCQERTTARLAVNSRPRDSWRRTTTSIRQQIVSLKDIRHLDNINVQS